MSKLPRYNGCQVHPPKPRIMYTTGVALAQMWTDDKIGKLNMWTLFCDACIDFLNSQIWNEIMLELNSKPSGVYHILNWFFLPKPGFLEFILNFQQQKSLLNQCLPHFESKSYQVNSILNPPHQDLSNKQHKRHIPIPPKFSAMI